MKRFILIFITAWSLNIQAQNREIRFSEESWAAVSALAKQQNKLIFLDAYTVWCGPCKWMAANVFNRDSVADLFNQNFVNVKVDMEKGEGPQLKKRYGIQAFPTYLFINADGEVVHRMVGSMSEKEFLAQAAIVNDGGRRSSSAMAARFRAGERSRDFIMSYFSSLETAYEQDSLAKASQMYFDALAPATLADDSNWVAAKKYLNNPVSTAFQWLFAHRNQLIQKYGDKQVNGYFTLVFARSCASVRSAFQKSTDVSDAVKTKNVMLDLLNTHSDFPYAPQARLQLELSDLAYKKNWETYQQKLQAAIVDTASNKLMPFIMNGITDMVRFAPANYLGTAARWAEEISKRGADYFTAIQVTDLRARILRSQGNDSEAEQVQAAALKMRQDASKKGLITPPILKN